MAKLDLTQLRAAAEIAETVVGELIEAQREVLEELETTLVAMVGAATDAPDATRRVRARLPQSLSHVEDALAALASLDEVLQVLRRRMRESTH